MKYLKLLIVNIILENTLIFDIIIIFGLVNKKELDFEKKKPIYKKIYNYNIEMNKKILAYTIISNEFFNSQKFMISKPHFFNYKINKFIKNFN